MADLDNAIRSINEAAERTEVSTGFVDDWTTADEDTDLTNPNNGKMTPSAAKKVKEITTELFNGRQSELDDLVDQAENAAITAQSAANFKGQWSDLTGPLNIPASVYHNGATWILLNNLADVTLSEPGVSSDWFDDSDVLKTIALQNGVVDSSVSYLATGAVSGVTFFYDSSTQTVWRSLTPITGNIITIGPNSGGVRALDIDGNNFDITLFKLNLWDASGDFYASSHTEISVTPNVFSGYDVVTNISTYEFVTDEVLSLRGGNDQLGDLNILGFGASKENPDNKSNIEKAMEYANLSGITTVLVPDNEFISSQIIIPSSVILKGSSPMDGWARTLTYDYGSRIKLIDGADDYLIKIEANTKNWGLVDLILNGNKDGQTSYGSGCIRSVTEGGVRNFGGLISGVKCVNPKGWSAYLQGGPLNIRDTFFMSGAIISNASDTKISNVDFDGTDGLHGSLCLHSSDSIEGITECFMFGWGEIDNTKTLQEETGTVTTAGDITLTEIWLYDGAPVTCSGTTPTTNPAAIYFARKNGSVWELYTNPYGTGLGETKATFPVNGAIILRHGGTESVAYLSKCTRIGMSGVRFGGSNGFGLVIAESNRCHFNNIHTFNNNLRNIGASSVQFLNTTRCSVANSQLGEISAGVTYAVIFSQTADQLCTQNVIDSTVFMQGTASTQQVLDETTQPYINRNRFVCIGVQAGDGYDFGVGASENKDKEPGIFKGEVNVSTVALPPSSNTTIPITLHEGRGVAVSSNTLSLNVTANGLYSIKARLTTDVKPTTEVLHKIEGFLTNLPVTTVRSYTSSRTGAITVEFTANSDETLNISFESFTIDSGLSILGTSEYSWISISKLGDTISE